MQYRSAVNFGTLSLSDVERWRQSVDREAGTQGMIQIDKALIVMIIHIYLGCREAETERRHERQDTERYK